MPERSHLFEDAKIRDNVPRQMETHPSVDLAKVATLTDVQNEKAAVSNKFLTCTRPETT